MNLIGKNIGIKKMPSGDLYIVITDSNRQHIRNVVGWIGTEGKFFDNKIFFKDRGRIKYYFNSRRWAISTIKSMFDLEEISPKAYAYRIIAEWKIKGYKNGTVQSY